MICKSIVFVLLLFSISANADVNADIQRLKVKAFDQNLDKEERAMALWRIAERFRFIDNDSSEHYLNLTAEYSKKINFPEGLIRVYLSKGMNAESFGRLAEQNGFQLKALDLAEEHTLQPQLAITKFHRSKYYQNISKTDSALYFAQASIQHYEKAGQKYKIWEVKKLIGDLNIDLSDMISAEDYYMQAFEMTKEKGIRMDYGFMLYSMCILYRNSDQMEKFSNAAEAYISFLEESDKTVLENEFHLGFILFDEDSKTDILDQLMENVKIHESLGNYDMTATCYWKIGDIHLKKNNLQKAISAFEKAMKIDSTRNKLPTLKLDYQSLKKAHQANGDFQKALMYHELMDKIEERIKGIEVRKNMDALSVKFETAKKDEQIALNQLQIQKANRNQLLLFLAVIASLTLASLIYYFLRLKQRNNSRLEDKNKVISKALKEKDILLREIHHRVKNNLQMISALLFLQGNSMEDSEAKELIRESENRVQSMAMIHQKLYRDENLLGVDVKDYLDRLFDHLFDSYNIDEHRIKITKNIQIENLDVDTIIPLALIVNELVSNSLKYAFINRPQGNIHVEMKKGKEGILLQVADDGVGMPKNFDQYSSGDFGYNLINILTEKLKANWEIQQENGTCVVIQIPRAA